MASELRAVMSADLFMAAIEGDTDVLIPRLGLQPDEELGVIQVTTKASHSSDPEQIQTEHQTIQSELQSAIEASHSSPEQIQTEHQTVQSELQSAIEASHSSPEQIQTEHHTIQSELQSATGFGDTVLHLLVTEQHNRLALKVFQRDRSLLNARNKLSETPLHCAAKVGNEGLISDLIKIDSVIMKNAIKEKDENGDTPLHVAAKYGHMFIVGELMGLDEKIAHRVNNEKLFPLYIAIMKNYTKMVIQMLKVDHTLACIPFSDGMFPVHISARMGNIQLVIHFIKQHPNYAKLLDPRRRNIFHIAAENNQTNIFTDVFRYTDMDQQMVVRMNNATDYEGNTPLHIAAMKGYKSIMKAIWENKIGIDAEIIENNEGLTPFKLYARQLKTNNEYIDHDDIGKLVAVKCSKFTKEWFDDVMKPAPINKWEITQVLGLGSVLITTVTFAAAFTIPGGYNQENGTPILGKRYMFRAFIVANTLAFIQGFVSLLVLLWKPQSKFSDRRRFATIFFRLAASSMVVAFGLGMYVTLAPICYPIAFVVLVITLFTGSPVGMVCSTLIGPTILKSIASRLKSRHKIFFQIVLLTIPFLIIFCLPLL